MIRKVSLDDAAHIARINNHYILNTTISFEKDPLSPDKKKERILDVTELCPYFVYEDEGKVVGFCYAHPWKAREAYRVCWETTVYVDPEYRRRGIGRLLMEALISASRRAGTHALIACITGDNLASCDFHASLGFERVSYFKEVGRKFDRWLDVTDYELIL